MIERKGGDVYSISFGVNNILAVAADVIQKGNRFMASPPGRKQLYQ
jgi:hypothetical protein